MSFSLYFILIFLIKVLRYCSIYAWNVQSLVVGQWLGVVVGMNVLESCLFYVSFMMNLSELITELALQM